MELILSWLAFGILVYSFPLLYIALFIAISWPNHFF